MVVKKYMYHAIDWHSLTFDFVGFNGLPIFLYESNFVINLFSIPTSLSQPPVLSNTAFFTSYYDKFIIVAQNSMSFFIRLKYSCGAAIDFKIEMENIRHNKIKRQKGL